MPTKLICHTPDCVSCGADGTCKLDGEIRVDQKRCQSYTPHSIPFMEKPLALSELPKEEWVCHILEESGATFVSLEDFYEPYGKALRRDLIWRIPYGCLDFSGCVLCLVQEGIPLPALRRGGQPGVRAVQNGERAAFDQGKPVGTSAGVQRADRVAGHRPDGDGEAGLSHPSRRLQPCHSKRPSIPQDRRPLYFFPEGAPPLPYLSTTG